METRIKEILKSKGPSVYTIEKSDTAFDALRKMIDDNVGSLIVHDRGNVVGIITERDYLKRLVFKKLDPAKVKVSEIMTGKVVCITPEFTAKECMAIMTERRFRHLPVVDNGDLVGLISIGDLVKSVSGDQETHIKYLTDYITGKYPS